MSGQYFPPGGAAPDTSDAPLSGEWPCGPGPGCSHESARLACRSPALQGGSGLCWALQPLGRMEFVIVWGAGTRCLLILDFFSKCPLPVIPYVSSEVKWTCSFRVTEGKPIRVLMAGGDV